MEYYVTNGYFGKDQQTIQLNIDNLNNMYEVARQHIMSDDATHQYIQENGLESLTISFYSGNL